ncbi:hypothetical protein PQR46_18630 [Paraburkholderia sediminicola]|uniref:hypothetical protein n=1 Tax=Paraburkholderia sediminicola TaxID=458836 RepID=UPI0038BC7843
MYHFNESSGTHQRLMAQLGMAKSQAHADALQTHLRRSGNAHDSDPGENVGRQIAKSSKDELLTRADTEAERGYAERKTALERQRAVRSARSDAGDDEDDEEMIDGAPQSRSLSKSLHAGAFGRLRTLLKKHTASMAKAIAAQDSSGEGFERYGAGFAAHVAEPVRIQRAKVVVAKPTANTFAKSLERTKSLMKSMGLEAGTGTDSATLTGGSALRRQSLSKRVASITGGGDPKPKQPTVDEIMKAASTALHANAISASDAMAIQHQVNTRGTCDDALLKKLRGEDAIATPTRLLTKSECHAAASKGLQSGRITAAQAIHCDMALSLDQPVDADVMQTLMFIHHGRK